MNDENAKYWLAFASIEKIGSVFIQTLFNHFGSVKSAWCAGPEELYKIETLTKRQVSDFLECRRNSGRAIKTDWDEFCREKRTYGISLI